MATSKKFRYQAKSVFLTYAHVGVITPEDILAELGHLGDVAQYSIGKEEYPKEPGKYHIHALVRYVDKIDTVNPAYFDVLGLHPNIKRIKNYKAALHYCIKDGDFIEDWTLTWGVNYSKEKANRNEWMRDRKVAMMKKNTWPITMPGGRKQKKPGPDDKKCNWLIVGPSDWGKSKWVYDTFKGKSKFRARASKYTFEGYAKEPIIICDDMFLTRDEIIGATGYYDDDDCTVGKTRYKPYFWAAEQRNVVVMIHNVMPEYASEGWFQRRFNIVILT